MLTTGFNHVAVLTSDTERLKAFYTEVFDAEVLRDGPEVDDEPDVRMTVIHVGPTAELNVFEIAGNTEAKRQTPMFGRGRLDHLALQAASIEAFDTIRDRLMARGAADDVRDRLRPDSQRVLPGSRRTRVRSLRRRTRTCSPAYTIRRALRPPDTRNQRHTYSPREHGARSGETALHSCALHCR